MYKIDKESKIVVITNEGFINDAVFSFDELNKLETLNPVLYKTVKEEVDSYLKSLLTEKEVKIQDRKSFIKMIKSQVEDGKSKIKLKYRIIINLNADGDKSRRECCPGFVAIYEVLPDGLYMTAWDDWSSGHKLNWDLDPSEEKYLNEAKSRASEKNEIYIKDREGNILFYHRGSKY